MIMYQPAPRYLKENFLNITGDIINYQNIADTN